MSTKTGEVQQGRSSIEVRNRKLRALRETHFASGAYTIGRHAAAEMLTLLKSKPIDQAVDHLLFCDYRLLHPKSVWQLNPAVCIQEKNLSSASSALGSYLEGERLAFAHFRKAKPTRFARSLRFLSFRYWAEKIQQWTSPSAVGFR